MRLAKATGLVLLTLTGGHLAAEPIVGVEYKCDSRVIYFGGENAFYSAPGVYEKSQINTSILDGVNGDQFRFKIPYGDDWTQVRQIGCGSNESGICERELAKASLEGETVTLSFRTEAEFKRQCGNLNDCGAMHVGIFFTLRDNQIEPFDGYTATFEEVTRYSDFRAHANYYFTDDLGNSFHNNMYRHVASRTNWTSECTN